MENKVEALLAAIEQRYDLRETDCAGVALVEVRDLTTLLRICREQATCIERIIDEKGYRSSYIHATVEELARECAARVEAIARELES